MKKSISLCLVAGFLLGGLSSCSSSNMETTDTPVTTENVTPDMAADTGADTLSAPDATANAILAYDSTNFAILAASNDLLEIMASEEALTKAKHPEVLNFARQMLTDHKKAYQDIQMLSTRKNQRVPTELLPKHQKMYVKYQEKVLKEPNKYDKVYMEFQTDAHEEAVELFDDGDENHPDPDLRAYAANLYPQIKANAALAKKTKDLVN